MYHGKRYIAVDYGIFDRSSKQAARDDHDPETDRPLKRPKKPAGGLTASGMLPGGMPMLRDEYRDVYGF